MACSQPAAAAAATALGGFHAAAGAAWQLLALWLVCAAAPVTQVLTELGGGADHALPAGTWLGCGAAHSLAGQCAAGAAAAVCAVAAAQAARAISTAMVFAEAAMSRSTGCGRVCACSTLGVPA